MGKRRASGNVRLIILLAVAAGLGVIVVWRLFLTSAPSNSVTEFELVDLQPQAVAGTSGQPAPTAVVEAQVRQLAALSATRDPKYLPRVLEATRAGDEQLRAAGVAGLGHYLESVDVRQATEWLERDPAPQVRAQAATLLAQANHTGSLRAVVKALRDADPVVRGSAYNAWRSMTGISVDYHPEDDAARREAGVRAIEHMLPGMEQAHAQQKERQP